MKLSEIMQSKFLKNQSEKKSDSQTQANKSHSNESKTAFKSSIPQHVLHQTIKLMNHQQQGSK